MSAPTLSTILEQVRLEAEQRCRLHSPTDLKLRARRWNRRSLVESLQSISFGVIAEIKRASPSAGLIRSDLDPAALACAYVKAGARGISVLTCGPYFQGSLEDLECVRQRCSSPVLCKDFLLSSFQILEAAAAGADVVLLIAAALSDAELHELSKAAHDQRMEVLFEAHTAEELERILRQRPRLLGVNSRNLGTMTMDPERALSLGRRLPKDALGIFESGIKESADLLKARAAGFRGALIGESLLRNDRPEDALRELVLALPP